MWSLKSEAPAEAPLDAHIMDILQKVDPARIAAVSEEGHNVDFFIGVFLRDSEPGGLQLSGSTLEELGKSRALVDIAFYPALIDARSA